MTVIDQDRPENDPHCSLPASCEGDCHSQDHQEDGNVPGEEVESHCADGCCADEENSDCESVADHCEDSCCGHDEDQSINEEVGGIPGTEHIGSCVGSR